MTTDKIFAIKDISERLSNLILIKEEMDNYSRTLRITLTNGFEENLECIIRDPSDYDDIKDIITRKIEKLNKELEDMIK